MKKLLKIIAVLLFISMLTISGYKLWEIYNNSAQEASIKEYAMQFKPDTDTTGTGNASGLSEPIVNQGIIDAQKQNPDIAGWISIPGTIIDYLFVQSDNLDYYLYRNIKQEYAQAGSIFMDPNCSKDFSDFNTILYGHNMNDGSMFGQLEKFSDEEFFNAHSQGVIYLPGKRYAIEIFAYMTVLPTDSMVYNMEMTGEKQKQEYLEYVSTESAQYKATTITDTTRIVTLSTCANDYNNKRMVLLAKITD